MTEQGTEDGPRRAGPFRRAAAEARILARRGATAVATADAGTLALVAAGAAVSWLLLRRREPRR